MAMNNESIPQQGKNWNLIPIDKSTNFTIKIMDVNSNQLSSASCDIMSYKAYAS
jgi:hypothetical protein